MPQENIENLIRSWNYQQGWNNGPVVQDKLSPEAYGRILTLFNHTWREEVLGDTFDWGTESYSVYLPESLYVISSIYLRIELPANSGGAVYKNCPGIYALRSVRLMSGGTEVYTADQNLFLHDYLESLSEEALRVFGRAYLGGEATPTDGARVVMIPILLPNSSYMGRAGGTHGHGIFPAFLGQSRLELQLTMNDGQNLSTAAGQSPTSIKTKCSIMYHQVEMTEAARKSYSDLRGNYSIVNRRFTELTSGWQQYTSANSVAHYNQFQPQGTVTEVLFIACAQDADDTRHTAEYILPTSITVTVDAVVVKSLDTPEKVQAELWQNGFTPNASFPSPGRMCFAAHAAGSDHLYSGGYNMRLASTVDFAFTFKENVSYRIVASQIQRVTIDAVGKLSASLTS